MSKKNTVAKGVLALAIAGLLVRVIGFLYRLPLTYLIGDDGNGIYGAGYQIYSFFFTISTTGIPVAISKMVSERNAVNKNYEAYRVFKISCYLMFFIGAITTLILGFGARMFAHMLNYDRAYYTMIALSPTLFFAAIMSSYRGYFQGFNDMVPTAISQIVEQVVKAAVAVFLAYFLIKAGSEIEISAAGATFGTTAGAFASLVVLMLIYRKHTKRFKIRKTATNESAIRILKNIIRLAVPVTIGASVITAGNLVDLFMIKSRLLSIGFSEMRASQLYGILTGKVVTILNLPTIVTISMATAIVPSIAASAARKEYRIIDDKIRTMIRLTMIIVMPSVIGLSVLANPIIKMLFPTQPEGGYILAVGAYYLIFLALSQNITSVFQAIGRPEIPAINLVVGVIIKVILNYYLISIPSINIVGTQISSIICYFITFILNYIFLKKYIKFQFPLVDAVIKPSIACCFMFVSVIFTYNVTIGITETIKPIFALTTSTILAIIVGGITYLLIILLSGAIKKEDIYLIKKKN